MPRAFDEAARAGNLVVFGRPLWLLDSITEAVGRCAGAVVVSGSHGGMSSARFALQAQVHAVAFNDAGVGKDRTGIGALDWLQRHGIAAVAVAHDSARIGEALSTWNDGTISAANAAAIALGAHQRLRLREWLQPVARDAGLNAG